MPIDSAVDEATARVALAVFGAVAAPPGGTAAPSGGRTDGPGALAAQAVGLAAQPVDREPDVRTRRFGDPT